MNDYETQRRNVYHESYDIDGLNTGGDENDAILFQSTGGYIDEIVANAPDVDFDDPIVAALPRVLLMGPRRGGKTSVLVCPLE
jgi:hypothetical protein